MRHLYLLLLCVPWCRSQLSDDEKKRLADLFGRQDDIDLSPYKPSTTQNPVNLSNSEKKRLEALYGKLPTPQPNPLSTIQLVNQTECDLEGKKGICIPYYLCNPDSNTVITDGATIIDIRGRACPHYLDVCCGLAETRAPSPPPAAPAQACGWSNAGAQSFRIKETRGEAQFGEFPWMVAILKRTGGSATWSQNDFVGGGAMIHPRAVITGAHKVDQNQASELKCRTGEYDTQTKKEPYPHQERNVEKIIKHEASVYNSIALLVLEAPYELAGAPHMGLACVARAPPAAGARCLGMGWGSEFNEKDKYAVVLKKLELPWLSRDICQRELRRSRLGSQFVLHPSLACAGGWGGPDTCRGDGGSPLVCPLEDAGRYAVFGLVAYGFGCGGPTPGVYVNVSNLYDWLTEKTRAEGLGTASYTY